MTVIGAASGLRRKPQGNFGVHPLAGAGPTRDGLVTVTGSRLKIGRLFREELVIDGAGRPGRAGTGRGAGKREPRS